MPLALSAALRPAALCAVLALGLLGCGGSANTLEGSLSDTYDLAFDRVDVQLVGGFLVVQYLQSASGARTLKLTVDLAGYTVSPGASINLAETGASGGPRGSMQRIVDSTISLPIDSGSLILDAVPAAGSPLGGNFSASFVTPKGRAVHGEFKIDAVSKP